MKKLLLLFTAICFITSSFAAFEVKPVAKKASEIFLPVGQDKKISLMELSTITINDFEKLTGKHLNFFDRIGFKAGQKKLRKSISFDGTINNKRLMKFTDSEGDHSTGFHLGGFALGFFLGAIGVLIAYLSKSDEDVRRNRIKWAWIGLGAVVVIWLILVAIVGVP